MEFTFRIYPNNIDGHAQKLTATQTAEDLDQAIDDATKILEIFPKSAEVVFMIECNGLIRHSENPCHSFTAFLFVPKPGYNHDRGIGHYYHGNQR